MSKAADRHGPPRDEYERAMFDLHDRAISALDRIMYAAAAVAVVCFLIVLLCIATGCAAVLPAVGAGLDGLDGVLKVTCPERTAACEKLLATENAATAAFNAGVLAEAVGEDSAPYAQMALLQLKAAWAAVQGMVGK